MSNDAQFQNAINGLITQIDAHKDQINELLTSLLNVKTNFYWLQKVNKDLQAKSEEYIRKIQDLEAKLFQLTPPADAVPESNVTHD